MYSQIHPYPEIRPTMVATYVGGPVPDPFAPSMLEDPIFTGDLAYEYLAREASETLGPRFSGWPASSPSTGYASSSPPTPPFLTNDTLFFPASPSSPLPREPPSPRRGQFPSKPSCRKGMPSFNRVRGKWSCSVCRDVFHDKYECERHIGSIGKQVMCLACGKTLCARKDNRKRHYTKYCKRMDLGRDGDLRLEDSFIEVY